MAFRDCFTFFLAFCFVSISALGSPNSPQIVVDIRNGLPHITQLAQLTLSCDQGSWFQLNVGDHYNRTLTADQDFECDAEWLRWFTTWNAYDDKRDRGHDTIYWLVKKDGFYQSWDGSEWKLLEYWTH